MANTSDGRLDGSRNRNCETSPSTQPDVDINSSFQSTRSAPLSLRGHGSSLEIYKHPLPSSLTLRFVIDNPELAKKLAEDRAVQCDVEGIIQLAGQRSTLTGSRDAIRAELNSAAKMGRGAEGRTARKA